MKRLTTLIILSISVMSNSYALDYEQTEITGPLKEVALAYLNASYCDFLLHAFTEGDKAYKERVKLINLQSARVWKEEYKSKNLNIIIAVAPKTNGGSISAIFMNKDDNRWQPCLVSINIDSVEQYHKLYSGAYDVCAGDYVN